MAERPSLLIATRNAGKLRELAPIIRDAGFETVTLDELGIAPATDEDSVESHETFEENAVAKARYYFGLARSRGLRAPSAVLADDSGLEVLALGGAPGVRSKRWSGSPLEGKALDAANNATLVEALRGRADRRARYVCVAAITSSRREVHARGECGGVILAAPKGDDGFGYDPYFFSDALKKTFGEATRAEKETVSHRARAVRAVLELFRSENPTAS
ncbi:MAG: non-canonical purine NTP pyrophosphatase [Gemmatimonadales bacterium]